MPVTRKPVELPKGVNLATWEAALAEFRQLDQEYRRLNVDRWRRKTFPKRRYQRVIQLWIESKAYLRSIDAAFCRRNRI